MPCHTSPTFPPLKTHIPLYPTDIPKLVLTSVINEAGGSRPTEVFSCCRYFALYEHGGIYADIDTSCLRPIDYQMAVSSTVPFCLTFFEIIF